jgi:N-methylhydantoinase A
MRTEFHRTLPTAGLPPDGTALTVLAALHADAQAWFAAEQVPEADRRTEEMALLRYEGQGSELTVPWSGTVAATVEGFAAVHKALYGFTLDAPVELVTLRVEAIGRLPDPVMPQLGALPPPTPASQRTVHFASGTRETPVYDRATLGAGLRLPGPAIVTQLDATTLVPAGWTIAMHPSGAMILERA